MFGALHRNWKTAIDHCAYFMAAASAVVKKRPRMSDRYNNILGNMVGNMNSRRLRVLRKKGLLSNSDETHR